ncbi:hypothetical protein A33M_2201 [Rhodovulum sp. PH10]|uniref:hypothetical protein n=1 Tax=Rhodovulum sp. PH10 TaxID=1187851 RepID=UPI00027C24EE|nr:hypothetical protein [Rhodovulum sp. PH10]EJW12291.1 hypothetical protein A33M_2201 [Rhodovulum sp. PH10]
MTRLLALGLALVSGTAVANAQTVISREVANEPVETIIARGPDGLTVIRRPLQTMAPPIVSTTPVYPTWGFGQPGWGTPNYASGWVALPAPPPPAGTVTVEPYAPADTVTTTVVEQEPVEEMAPPPRTLRGGRPPIMARAVEPDPDARPARATRVSRTATRRAAMRRASAAAPLPRAAPAEREVVYRTLVQEQTYDPALLPRVAPARGYDWNGDWTRRW